MGVIRVLPYVGSGYEHSRWGRRVMVIGESQCSRPKGVDANFVRNVMVRLLDGDGPFDFWMNAFIKFASALTGEQQRRKTCAGVWGEVMFYSYVQALVLEPRQAFSEEQLQGANEAFLEVLREWRPDAVLVWGSHPYEGLPFEGCSGEPCEGVGTWVYSPAPGYSVNLLKVQHPASSFSWKGWHPIIRAFLTRS